jgi:uncharacterized protein (DUF1697 family)
MGRYVAFLRGMNLGKRRISNEELAARVSGLGFDGVSTFRASGNVLLDAGGRVAEKTVAGRLEDGLEAALGYPVPVFLRSARQVDAIAARHPFDAGALSRSRGKLQVALLRRRPAAAAVRRAVAMATDEDRLTVEGRELYWLPSGGISESTLDLDALASELGEMTIRTKGTIEQIAARLR